MSWVIDLIAAIGGCLVVAGVYLQYGLATSLMTAGALLIAFALKAAKVQEDKHVFDSE